jgi:hypothetical protein
MHNEALVFETINTFLLFVCITKSKNHLIFELNNLVECTKQKKCIRGAFKNIPNSANFKVKDTGLIKLIDI